MRSRLFMLAVPMAALGLTTLGGATAHAAGTTLYVTTNGLDTNPCSKSLPCRTMQHAVDIAPVNATVQVAAGHYNQSVNITKPVSLVGAGASKTVIDGTGVDTAALGYYGVVSVQNNPGTGGAIVVSGFTIENAFVTPAESSQLISPSDVSVYGDLNSADRVTITDVVLAAVQDPTTYGGIGLDTFNNAANVVFTRSVSTGNFQGALLEGGGVGGKVTVTNVDFTALVPCGGGVNGCSGSSAVYAPEGLFVLSDQPGTAQAVVNNNVFHNYAGDGVAVDAGYAGGNCSNPNPACTGDANAVINGNSFDLEACTTAQACAAIYLHAQPGSTLTAAVKDNHGEVDRPDRAIVVVQPGGTYHVTQQDNDIKVD